MADLNSAGSRLLQDEAFRADLAQAVAARKDWAVTQLCNLVRARTTLGNEAEGQALMADAFAQMGLAVDSFDVDPQAIANHPGFAPSPHPSYANRPNVVGTHLPHGDIGGQSLILNGHIDVVPAGEDDLWSQAPFEPKVADGKVFGRGAADMKAGLVANSLAFLALQDLGYAPAAPVGFQSVIEEECTGNGTLACIARGYGADAVIIPEPFDQTILTSQLGVMWVTVHVRGRPAHVLDTSAGVNAIVALYKVFEGLEQLESEWNAAASKHPAYDDQAHPINFNLGCIQGGDWASTVPSSAWMRVRIAYYPGIDPAEAQARIEQRIAETAAASLPGAAVTVSYTGHRATGQASDISEPLFARLAEAHRRVMKSDPRHLASTATTDSRFYALHAATPATCYGPRGGDYHGIDEWVSVQSMLDVGQVLAGFMVDWCGLEKRQHG